MIFLILFYEIFKIGLFSVGGGLATIPFLSQLADKYPWFDTADLVNMIAVSESTPGPMGINMATYAGFNAAGILGGLTATFSIILPAFITICLVSKCLERFKGNSVVESAFFGIRPAVAGLIVGAVSSLFIIALFSKTDFSSIADFFMSVKLVPLAIYAVITLIYAKFKKLHPIYFIISGAVLGLVFSL